ncbi:MAG: RidA family protein [Sutterella sp.]|nr:RidA family protein [Sutterella sp.]
MAKTVIHTDAAPGAIGAYSQGIKSEGMVYASGQIGLDPATGTLREGVEAQARQAFSNLSAILAAGGTTLESAVKISIFLADINDFAVVNKVMQELVPEPFPARSCFAVAALPKGALVEVEAIAEIP